MKKHFCLLSLLAFSLSASAAGEWLYYKHYPWVYDNATEDWLYLQGAANGTIYAYRASTKKWEEFAYQKEEDVIPVSTWEEQYEEWVQNPEPYGGLSVLQRIKYDKDHSSLVSDFSARKISDLTPLAGLTTLRELFLAQNNISDLTPLAGLTNLLYLNLSNNQISDLTPLAGLTNLRFLHLRKNQISDITPLTGLTNLRDLHLSNNQISDLTPLAGLTNLKEVWLDYSSNEINDSQIAMLEAALPNTYISYNSF